MNIWQVGLQVYSSKIIFKINEKAQIKENTISRNPILKVM